MRDKAKNANGRPPSQRQLRVGEMLRRHLSQSLRQVDFPPKFLPSGSNITSTSLAVTEVRVSPDLRHATAYIMPLGGAHMQQIVDFLNDEAARFKKLALTGFRLKYTPKLRFAVDTGFDVGAAMDRLLDSEQVVRDTQKSEAEDL